MTVVVLTEFLLYICFAVMTGSMIIYTVPKGRLPDVTVPKKAILYSIIGSIVLSIGPVISTIIIFGKDIGYWTSFKSVLFGFDIGKAWIFMLVIGLLLFGLVYFNDINHDPFLSKIALLLVVLLIGGYAKASHAASLAPFAGFTYHYLHLIAVAIWGGLLITTAWFSKKGSNWLNFLKWFTPLASICLVIIILSGILTMSIDIAKPADHSVRSLINQYDHGLMVNYGQSLLIKHILIVPLVIYAVMNAFVIRRRLKRNRGAHPLKWARVETIIIMAIFSVTAFLGQQSPPHDIVAALKVDGASPLFNALYPGVITPETTVHWSFNLMSISFLILGILMAVMTTMSVANRFTKGFSIFLAFCLVLSSYLTVMLSID
ncbi:putative copper resistance protein D [Scopulibacillus darangshiensis]|uniref:Putative copper resistance protein D n=1 Tax=Scopulibacillus darangshiensis TaxID=442528 RepID=A0A4R2P6P1_9BACL|nr:CopD family protein [Scopulibacillus darangshiensis]TCP29824.1 putative copper resistance protein D [Scopulibacillus darangshiensis]